MNAQDTIDSECRQGAKRIPDKKAPRLSLRRGCRAGAAAQATAAEGIIGLGGGGSLDTAKNRRAARALRRPSTRSTG